VAPATSHLWIDQVRLTLGPLLSLIVEGGNT
jgi:hypothetical protein